jgi:cardiolipin synthase
MLTDLPNLLTLSRIAAIPLLVALVAARTPFFDLLACFVFILAGITDYLDGHYARTRRQLSEFGRMLDPIADKLLVGATLMMLAGEQRLSAFGLFPAVVIILRFQMGALGTLLAGDTGAGILHLSFLPVGWIGEAMLWVAAALTLITGWDYMTAGLQHASGSHAARLAAERGEPSHQAAHQAPQPAPHRDRRIETAD